MEKKLLLEIIVQNDTQTNEMVITVNAKKQNLANYQILGLLEHVKIDLIRQMLSNFEEIKQ